MRATSRRKRTSLALKNVAITNLRRKRGLPTLKVRKSGFSRKKSKKTGKKAFGHYKLNRTITRRHR
jgi:hypothetical protein